MINTLERQNLMMKSRLKTLVGAGESTGQGPQGDSSVSHDLELLARFQDYPRQELGSSKFYNKFQSGFSASLLQVLNTSNSYSSKDQKDGDIGPILGIQQLSSEQYNSDLMKFSKDREELSSKVRSESKPFLGALGPLNRGTQGVDPNPFLGALGSLRNSHRSDSVAFNHNHDVQNANFSSSASSSFFFEAL